MMNRSIVTILLLMLSLPGWAEVKAILNQATVFDGDPVKLTIEVDRNTSDKPDISVLNKDFIVQSTGQSSNFSMVNGNTSYTKSWNITLLPRRKGELVIPAIRLGAESTKPIKLIVADITPEMLAKNSQHVSVEAIVGLENSQPYVQQQIPYTLKLYSDETIRNGDLYPPNIEDAVIEKISGDKQYSITRGGKRFNVLERSFVISPEKSGKLQIPSAIFKGKQVEPRRQKDSRFGDMFDDQFFNDPFFNSSPFGSRGKSITTRSEPIEIDILPIPAEFKGKSWLPVEDLVVKDSWNDTLPSFQVGEPVTRNVTLQAKGLAGSQIPEFNVAQPQKMRAYPDQAKTDTKTDGSTVFGLRQQTYSYIPSAAGKIVIPAVKVDWWNVLEKKQESFVVPEQTVLVLPGAGNAGTQASSPVSPVPATQDSQKGVVPESETAVTDEKSGRSYAWWLLIGLGFVAVYFAYRFVSTRQKKPAKRKIPQVKPEVPRASKSQQLNELQQACERNDKAQAAKALLALADVEWPDHPPKNLGVLADRLEAGSELVRELDRSLYASESGQWQGATLWQALQHGLKPKSDNKNLTDDGVAGLYPTRV